MPIPLLLSSSNSYARISTSELQKRSTTIPGLASRTFPNEVLNAESENVEKSYCASQLTTRSLAIVRVERDGERDPIIHHSPSEVGNLWWPARA